MGENLSLGDCEQQRHTPAHPRSLISTFVIHLLESIISILLRANFNVLAHQRSLISAFVVHLLESIISRLATSEISMF